MKNKFILLGWALGALVLSCQQPESDVQQPGAADPETKVVQLGDVYDPSSFLVKFKAVPTADDLAACYGDGVLSVEPVFRSFPGKEALERQFGLDRWYQVKLEEGVNVDRTIRSVAALDKVAVAEYSHIAQKEYTGEVYPAQESFDTKAVSGTFNDPMLLDQWHYNNQGSAAYSKNIARGADVNVNDVWKRLTCGDPDIIVAVVDEGVKFSHPDLVANMWTNPGEIAGNGIDDDGNGYIDDVHGLNFVTGGEIEWTDFYTQNGRTYGDSGHGTHCAGTIAAVNNNNKGVSGIAGGTGKGDGCRIMSCQIFSGTKSGSGSAAVTANAVKYAADMGASVISCSFGYSYPFVSDNNFIRSQSSLEIDAIHYFEASKNNPVLDGNIAIFAAGNESHNYAHYPGAFVDIISVSAFAPDFLPTYYTNYGPGCNIAAPGGEVGHSVAEKSMVLSTLTKERYGDDYGYMQGTSMACPHVSGVVALALSYAKQLGKTFTRDEFKQIILSSTNDIDQRIGSSTEKSYPGYNINPIKMSSFYHQMGTGAIDAWRLMMNIEGTPALTAQIGKSQWITLEDAFGSSSVSLTYLNVDIPQSTIDALGLQKISGKSQEKYPCTPEGECYGYVQFGRLYIYPTKLGSGKLTVKAVGGGDHVGGGSNPPGGMELDREISIIARDVPGDNGMGGWL